jgi:putative ABC transport system substrate-binding protein
MPVRGSNRRTVIAAFGSAAAWPLVARGQQSAVPVIAYVSAGLPNTFPNLTLAFQQGLKESGFTEGKTVIVERRYGEGRFDRLPNLVAELARHHVDVIVLGSGPFPAVQSAAQGIPIVSVFGNDPMRSGLVARLNRPAGNVTGVVLFSYSLGAKRLEVLREAVPKAHVIAMLTNAANPDPETKSDAREVEIAARAIGQEIVTVDVDSERDFESAFVSIARQADALIAMADPVFATRRQQLAALAERHRIPAIYEWREMVAAGGLMSYGSSMADAWRLLGVYAGKILKGEKPADLPVEQSVKIELVLNLKTAKALGLTFPPSLLARADEVIE